MTSSAVDQWSGHDRRLNDCFVGKVSDWQELALCALPAPDVVGGEVRVGLPEDESEVVEVTNPSIEERKQR